MPINVGDILGVGDAIANVSRGGSIRTVDVLDNRGFIPIFVFPGFIVAEPKSEIRAMQYPIESGSVITDHFVIEPNEITLRVIFTSGLFNDYDTVRSYLSSGVLVTIQCRGGIYRNMIFVSARHREAPEHLNALMADLTFREVIIVRPEYGQPSRNKGDSSSIQTGEQTPSASNGSDLRYWITGRR